MIDSLRTALIAAGLDPDEVQARAAALDLNAPTRHEQAATKADRVPAPVMELSEQLGLDGVGEATGVVTIRPGTKKHEALARLRGTVLESGDIEFLGEFKAAGLVRGGDAEGWTASPQGEAALGMLDYGSIAKAEKGKPVTPERNVGPISALVAGDEAGKFQHEGQSATSRTAAEQVAPITGKARLAVLACIHIKGGATDEEVEVALGMNPSTVRPRRVELVQAEAVVDSGTTRKTSSGHTAVVWTTTPFGAEAAAEHLARLRG